MTTRTPDPGDHAYYPDPDPLTVTEADGFTWTYRPEEPKGYSTNPVTSGVWFLAGLLVVIAVLVAYALAKGGAR